MGYFNREVYFYIFTWASNLFLPILNIFIHIPNYFHVYLYLYLTYLDIFSCMFIPIFNIFRHIFMYIYTYFHHKSVVFYNRLPQKCVVLLQIATKVCCIYHNLPVFTYIYHKSVVFYRKISFNFNIYWYISTYLLLF